MGDIPKPVVIPGTEDGIPEVQFDEKVLLQAAIQKTDLSDWGDDSFKLPFRKLIESLETEANLSEQGRFLFWSSLMRLLCNRLKIQNDLNEHRQIREVKITKPLFVLGLPRTGTTLLHKLLACDPQARAILLWEGLYPSPPPKDETRDSDERIESVAQWIQLINALAPDLVKAHVLKASGPEECLWLIEHTFADLIFELRAHVPSYSRWLEDYENRENSGNQEETYRYYRTLLQVLCWRCDRGHWVLKAPRHLFGLKGLLGVFPDARIVQTHRDPGEVLPSLCSLCGVNRRIYSNQVDDQAIGKLWFNKLEKGLMQAMRVRDDADADQFLDIHYRQLIADPIAAVKQIYEHHDYCYCDQFESNMRQWLEANKQHQHGKHEYFLETYALDRKQVDKAFEDYRTQFDL